MTFEELTKDHQLTDIRREIIEQAIQLGASDKVLLAIRDATRVHRSATMILPSLHFESLSRGRGWARKGRGNRVSWGDRVEGGYAVGEGRWTVGANDGFSRKQEVTWDVKQITVGTEIWTIAW